MTLVPLSHWSVCWDPPTIQAYRLASEPLRQSDGGSYFLELWGTQSNLEPDDLQLNHRKNLRGIFLSYEVKRKMKAKSSRLFFFFFSLCLWTTRIKGDNLTGGVAVCNFILKGKWSRCRLWLQLCFVVKKSNRKSVFVGGRVFFILIQHSNFVNKCLFAPIRDTRRLVVKSRTATCCFFLCFFFILSSDPTDQFNCPCRERWEPSWVFSVNGEKRTLADPRFKEFLNKIF